MTLGGWLDACSCAADLFFGLIALVSFRPTSPLSRVDRLQIIAVQFRIVCANFITSETNRAPGRRSIWMIMLSECYLVRIPKAQFFDAEEASQITIVVIRSPIRELA